MKYKNVYIHSEIYVSRHCHVFVYVYDNEDRWYSINDARDLFLNNLSSISKSIFYGRLMLKLFDI